jgi:hypothetical protein
MEVYVHEVGIRARQIIACDQDAIVTGATSRGYFIFTDKGSVLFLSVKKHRGPLTLNLNVEEEIFGRINLGDSLRIQNQCLIFPKSSILISVRSAKEWEPTGPSSTLLFSDERQHRINTVCQRVLSESEMFPKVKLDRMHFSLHSNSEKKIVTELETFLGRGVGLTPSGDDLIIGILLTLNRWGKILYPFLSMERINHPLIQASRQSTTALSASLIECATQAQADERLILALDSLVTGEPELDTCITCLMEYGGSSGRDTFLGMKLVLT